MRPSLLGCADMQILLLHRLSMIDGLSFQKRTQNHPLDQTRQNPLDQPPTGGETTRRPEDRLAPRSSNQVFSGKASYYSYPIGKTASGASFSRHSLTAAHRNLPFGTSVRVTDLASNKSVVVRINDRGPWVRGRVLDLSLGAARSLGITDRGVAQVRAEVL